MIRIAFLGLLITLSGCSNFNEIIQSESLFSQSINPLKTQQDRHLENSLVGGTWHYQTQQSDCNDTYWTQQFYKNKYYKSGGSTCLLTDTFSVGAESWHVKDRILYIVNLSPRAGEDVILKYAISMAGRNKLILRSGRQSYTFFRKYL